MEEQFAHLCSEEEGQIYISLDAIKEYLNFGESSNSESIYRRLLGGSGLEGKRIPYSDFIEFLETGRDPETNEGKSPSRRASKIRILKGFPSSSKNKDLPIPGKASNKTDPPGTPEDRKGVEAVQSSGLLREKHEAALRLAQTLASADYTDNETQEVGSNTHSASSSVVKEGKANEQSEGTPDPKGSGMVEGESSSSSSASGPEKAETEELPEQPAEYEGPEPIIEEQSDDDDDAGSGSKGDTAFGSQDLMLHPNANNPMFRSSSSSSVWRKREVVKHERQTYYTTVDADGKLQELVEKETSQTEVLHMESRDTGEFAHRETTVYTQQETFNDEVVGEKDGEEEYVHLKSENDEYEHTTSNMPPKDGEPQSSPRVGSAEGTSDPRDGYAAAAEAQGGVGHIDLTGVDPDHLDEDTKAYFCWVLEAQQHEAASRLAAMKQQQDLAEQASAFDGLEESDLDDETRAYREYLTQGLTRLGEYLSTDPGDGVMRQMIHLQNLEAMEGAEQKKATEEGDEQRCEETGAAASDHVFTRVPTPKKVKKEEKITSDEDDDEEEEKEEKDDAERGQEGDKEGEEMDRERTRLVAQEALAAAIAAAGAAHTEEEAVAVEMEYEEVAVEPSPMRPAAETEEKGVEVEVEEESSSMHDID